MFLQNPAFAVLTLVVLLFSPLTSSSFAQSEFTRELVVNNPATAVKSADIDSDGELDIIVTEGGKHSGGKNILAWFKAPNWQRFDIAKSSEAPVTFTGDLLVHDVNSDGCIDVILSLIHISEPTRPY